MIFTLYTSNSCGVATNCSYPNEVVIKNLNSLKDATINDYVVAKYKQNYRSIDNFIASNCIAFDCDNDFSDNPKDWISTKEIQEIFKNIKFAVHYSRNHNKEKNGKAPRPKFHIFFPIKKITNLKKYKNLKSKINELFPIFDDNAIDSARFFFGTPNSEVQIFEGELTIDTFIASFDEKNKIKEGSRNTAMSHFAGKIIKRFGDSDIAYEKFIEHSLKCSPPLEDEELNTIWRSAQKFFKNKISKNKDYVLAEDYEKEKLYVPEDFTDIGQAKVLAKLYKDSLVYTDATDYMVYVGTHWKESKQLAIGTYEKFLDLQLEDATNKLNKIKDSLGVSDEVLNSGGRKLEKILSKDAVAVYTNALNYYKFVLKRRDMKFISNVLQAAKPMFLREIKEFDKDEFALNTPVGTIDLVSGKIKEHSSNDLITKITEVSPNANNKNLWLKAVDDFFCGDKELIEYVKQTVGLAAIGSIKQEAMIIAYGEGANGKSTFWNSIARVLGDYSGVLSSDVLTTGCKRNIKPEKAELKGKRLIIAAELEEGTRLSTSMVKQITSTDEVSAEKKYKDPFKYTPTHTLVLYTNHLPKVGATDNGTWRRLIVIPFNAKLKTDIKNYADFLFKKCGGAILQWIIEGAMEVIKNEFKLKQPQAVIDSISKYREDNDWFNKFVDECCEVDPSKSQKSGEFYQEYRNFCLRTGEFIRGTTDFYNTLENSGYTRKKTKNGILVIGISLKQEFI